MSKSLRLQGAMARPLPSSLGNRARLCLKRKKKVNGATLISTFDSSLGWQITSGQEFKISLANMAKPCLYQKLQKLARIGGRHL